MYFPKSQITTNLYTNGGEYVLLSSNVDYKGPYWKTFSGKYYTGHNPQSSNIVELVRSNDINAQPSIDQSVPTTLEKYSTFYRLDDGERPFESYGDTPSYGVVLDLNYVFLKKIDIGSKILIPSYSPVLPTQQDYKNGEFIRYFCIKSNEIIYTEIDKDTHDKLLNQDPTILYQLYIPFSVFWKLTGDKTEVYKVNKNMVELTSFRKKLSMFSKYLKEDYTKYYKEKP